MSTKDSAMPLEVEGKLFKNEMGESSFFKTKIYIVLKFSFKF